MIYRQRDGKEIIIQSKQDAFLAKIYNCKCGRMLMKILSNHKISEFAGLFLNSKASKIFINSFVKKNNIPLYEYTKKQFCSYNDFFSRKIKSVYRPIDMISNHFIAPCDSKLTIYQIDQQSMFQIKHSKYSVESLLKSKNLAKHYNGGYCAIFRLTVDNYHRYCYVDSGKKSVNKSIPGFLNTVNPVILNYVNIYKENSREYTLLKTDHFGTVIQIEIGALMVGKITNYHQRKNIKKGEEKGRFEFGGSTIVLLIQPNKVEFDNDILENTNQNIETIVRMGEKIGVTYKKTN